MEEFHNSNDQLQKNLSDISRKIDSLSRSFGSLRKQRADANILVDEVTKTLDDCCPKIIPKEKDDQLRSAEFIDPNGAKPKRPRKKKESVFDRLFSAKTGKRKTR